MSLPDGKLPGESPDVLFPHLNSFLTYDEVQRNRSRTAYITAEFSEALFPTNGQFVIGGSNQPNDQPNMYTNVPLQTGKSYSFFLRAYPNNTNVRDKYIMIHFLAGSSCSLVYIQTCSIYTFSFQGTMRQYSSFISSNYTEPVRTGTAVSMSEYMIKPHYLIPQSHYLLGSLFRLLLASLQ